MQKQITALLVLCLLAATGCGDEQKKSVSKNTKLEVMHTYSYHDTFDSKDPAWQPEEGSWVFANHMLTQTEKEDYFPLVLFKKKKFEALDVSVKFKPISGRIDASGGVVFRAQDEENYYIVRANALEDNFRLYYFKDGARHQMASATVTPPPLGQYSSIRIIAKGDHIQAYLNKKLEIDYHDTLYTGGYVGLWTKADSVTTFDDFQVSGK